MGARGTMKCLQLSSLLIFLVTTSSWVDAQVPTVSFTLDNFVALESEGIVEVCIMLNAPLAIVLDVSVTVTSGNATEGIDFTVLNSPIELTLRPGTTEACTDDIQIIDDEIYEGKEIITLELMPIFPIPVGISTAVVTINDDDILCEDGAVRLVNGTVPDSGRVEICFNNEWGTVCDDIWDDNDATVVCRQLGLPSTASRPWEEFVGEAEGSIWLDDVMCSGAENFLQMCPHGGLGNHDCTHREDAGVICPHVCEGNAIRLVGGNDTAGRVEVCYNNVWGSVCDDVWDISDARVVCRQLGIPSQFPSALRNAAYGEGDGPIWLDNLRCNGNESSLQLCPHMGVGESNCDHDEDAGVVCIRDSVLCEDGAVRLVNGTVPDSGRVEICFNNEWGTVCDDIWDDNDATVVCRQLGLPSTASRPWEGFVGEAEGSIWLDEVMCSGAENFLQMCPHGGLGNHDCTHREDAGVICPYVCEGNSIRLVGGNDTAGRVEVCGSVCDDVWDVSDARVVCRQLGIPSQFPSALRNAAYGEGDGPIWLDNLRCNGNESSLQLCPHMGVGESNCDHDEDAGVVCIRDSDFPPLAVASFSDGRCDTDGVRSNDPLFFTCELNNVVVLRVVLPNGFVSIVTVERDLVLPAGFTVISLEFEVVGGDPRSISLTIAIANASLLAGGEITCDDGLGEIAASAGCPLLVLCEDGAVRLVNGTVPDSGRVEICFNNEWGTVCDDIWDDNDATVVCRQLGLPSTASRPWEGFVGEAEGSIWLDDVMCSGAENFLQMCPHGGLGNHDCTHREDAGVICPYVCEGNSIRLGGNDTAGRVEVCYNNVWGSVCDDVWDISDARVVCRQLGIPSQFPSALRNAAYGEGDGPIWLDNLRCNGNESSLQLCPHMGVGESNCDHDEDAGVVCIRDSDFPPLAVASFSDGRCDTDGVRSNDPLFFTCELNNVVVLRVVLPNGFVSVFVHDESDLVLPAGFTVMSVEVVGGDPAPRSISLTIAIANASLLAGGEITCDDGVGEIAASAGCPLLLGSLPLVLNRDVSPPGTYSVRIVASTGGEATVEYTIMDTNSDVPAEVPPLEVYLMNGSPRVTESSVEAEFEVTRPVAGVRCFLRSKTGRTWKDCSSGRVSFPNLKPGRYALKIQAYNRKTDMTIAKRSFMII